MKELIEQIGRERLEDIAQFHRSMSLPPSHDEIEAMARALLAVLEAKPVIYVPESSVKRILSGERSACCNIHSHSSKQHCVGLYATPPEASVQEAIGEVRLGDFRDDGTRHAMVVCLHDQADWENFADGTKLYLRQ